VVVTIVFDYMLEQYDLIHNTEWNTLILLDACRFDLFKKLNKIPGKLQEVHSEGHHTWVWLNKTFPGKYPWTYFSAHPYVNAGSGQKWNAVNHFERIIPIWSFGWNDKLGTVHPDTVGQVAKNIPYEKAIVHYIQPHGPWIGKTKWLNPWTLADYSRRQLMGDWIAVLAKPDPAFFRQCYKDNLRLVLDSVEKYLPFFRRPVVVSADHGELLGEKGLYLHGAVKKEDEHKPYPVECIDFLRRVPWFEVE
jgi:hypothetical protein